MSLCCVSTGTSLVNVVKDPQLSVHSGINCMTLVNVTLDLHMHTRLVGFKALLIAKMLSSCSVL